jgi:hypothetical protein
MALGIDLGTNLGPCASATDEIDLVKDLGSLAPLGDESSAAPSDR